jgi:multifunctional methyltransferase subunit TRM112
MLISNIKGVTNGFPLGIEASDIKEEEADFNEDFIKNFIPKLEWSALVAGATAMNITDLPAELTDELKGDVEFLKKLHHILLEVHLIEGNLICPETGRKFPVKDGIPNMLLNEDEV